MVIDENRLKVQKYALSLWEKTKKASIEWATGTGKSYIGRLAMEMYPEDKKLVIVPSEYLETQWKSNNTDIKNFEVVVINTAIKNTYNVDLLILDETHRYNADTFRKLFNVITYNKVLGLTAIFERNDKKHYFMEQYCPVVHKLPIKEALRLGFISDMIVYNYGLEINKLDRTTYDYWDNKFNNFFAFFNFEFTLAMDCLKKPEVRRIYSNRTGYSEKDVQVMAINFNRAMQKRKELIFYSQDKFNAVIKLAEIYKDKKIMIFTERVNVANLLQKAIPNSFVYNPKKSEKALTKLMNEYKEMDNGVLIAAKALDEGMDIPGIDIGIIHSNSSSKLQGTQRNGRIIRKSNDKVALIINLYLENTQDKKWLLRRIEGIPNMYWTNDINQITYDPSEECLKEENRTSDFTQRIKLF